MYVEHDPVVSGLLHDAVEVLGVGGVEFVFGQNRVDLSEEVRRGLLLEARIWKIAHELWPATECWHQLLYVEIFEPRHLTWGAAV